MGRYVPPFQEGEDSVYFESFNRNKRSVSLDLRVPEGRAAFEDLVAQADAVVSNLRGGQAEKLGLTYAQLAHRNAQIVCCALTGFGSSRPARARAATTTSSRRWPVGCTSPATRRARRPSPACRWSTSRRATSRRLRSSARYRRARRDGAGCDCDISLFETALAELAYVGTWAATGGFDARRMKDSAHPSIVPFQAFETSTAGSPSRVRSSASGACCAKRPAVRSCASDPRYATFADRDRNRDELLAILRDVFRERTSAEWLES